VVASPAQGEDKGTACADLGIALATAGKSTLLLDCDFRNSSVHEFFGLHKSRGMVDVLARTHRLQEVWEEPVKGLKVVPTGPIPPNPEDLLGPRGLSELLASVREEGFDYILIRSPSVGSITDPSLLVTQGDGILLVLDLQKTPKGSSIAQAGPGLRATAASVLRTVANKINAGSLPEQKPHPEQQQTRRERRTVKKNRGLLEFLIMLVTAFALVFGILRPFVVEPFYIPTESMVPTLEVDDWVLTNKFIYRSAEPKRGDIVVFESSEFGEDLIKRVVGLPGDNILIVRGSLYVNGEQQKEPYLNTELSDQSSYGPDTVPPGHVFVMGDNRADSSDSRIFGPVPEESILGKAFLRLWPPSRIGSIET
jgi:signal peptidase I